MEKKDYINRTALLEPKTGVLFSDLDIMEEIWKDIKGYEGSYQASNLGNIKSLERMVQGKIGMRICNERILKILIGKRGYYTVNLGNGTGRCAIKTVHRLVAIAFIPNPENRPCVNHIDGNKLNNNINNIEWCTYSENNIHAFNTGLKIPTWEGISGKDHCRSVKVAKYDRQGNFIRVYDSIGEATKDVGLKSYSLIGMCAQKKKHQLTAAGFLWEYV